MTEKKWLKRQAIQIASMLPDDNQEAAAVLRYVQILVDDFLASGEGRQELSVVSLREKRKPEKVE